MSDLKQKFEETLELIKNGEGAEPSNDLKLRMYSLFKQATAGDVSGSKPGIMDFVGRAKYTAWEELKGMSSDEAMQTYIDAVAELTN